MACGGVQRLPDGAAEIKRMWVHDGWRGAGLGARLLRHLEDLARDRGHALVRLDTNDTLLEAIAMYERAGYRSIARYNDNQWARCWFEKPLDATTAAAGGRPREAAPRWWRRTRARSAP